MGMRKNILMNMSVGVLSMCLFGGTVSGISAGNTSVDTCETAETPETAAAETASGQVSMSDAVSKYVTQVMAAPEQNVSAVSEQNTESTKETVVAHYWCSCGFHTTDKKELMKHTVEGNREGGVLHSYNTTYRPAEDSEDKTATEVQSPKGTMVRVCQCKEHFVMEGDWKTEWRKHVINVHRGSCHWADNEFTEEEMRKAWPEDFEDEMVEDTSEKEAAEQAAKEQAEREAAEQAAREQAEREAAEKAAKEQAEREAAEQAAREQAEREAAEQAAREQAEREATEQAAREQAEREAAEQAAREQAEREAAEKAARKAAQKAAEQAWWEAVEKKRCDKCGTEYPADAEHGCAVVYHEYKLD